MYNFLFFQLKFCQKISILDVIKKAQTSSRLISNLGAQARTLRIIDVPLELIPSSKFFTSIYQI